MDNLNQAMAITVQFALCIFEQDFCSRLTRGLADTKTPPARHYRRFERNYHRAEL